MSDDFPSKQYFWALGSQKCGYPGLNVSRETGWDVHDMHEYACDELSRRIAVETGQAKEIAPGVIQLKEPHIYYVNGDRHEAVIGDRWKPEICRSN